MRCTTSTIVGYNSGPQLWGIIQGNNNEKSEKSEQKFDTWYGTDCASLKWIFINSRRGKVPKGSHRDPTGTPLGPPPQGPPVGPPVGPPQSGTSADVLVYSKILIADCRFFSLLFELLAHALF